MKDITLVILAVSVLLASCGNYDPRAEGISSGTLKIGVDDSYSLMMDSQVFVYEQNYKYADIKASYMPEGDVIDALLKDSIQAAVISRPLTDEELNYFKSKQRFPESLKIATDGVALVTNLSNPDSVVTMEQLQRIFNAVDTTWKQINAASSLGKINIVFDNNKSCNGRTIKEFFLKEKQFAPNCFAVNSNDDVIKYVSQNPGAIGVISLSWFSDRDDPKSKEILSKVRPIGIIDPTNADRPTLARRPYQAYVFDQSYPLRRDVYYIRTGLKGSLGTGFASHLAGEKGQLIIHKMGMVAATSPVRQVKIVD